MGSELIGYSKEDSIIWDFPNGTQQINIKEVKQNQTYSGIDIVI